MALNTKFRGFPLLHQGRCISYDELKQHSLYSDAWLSINGIVYDITHFINKHPFGDTFRGHLGSECGGLFSSAHLNTNVEELIKTDSFLKKNGIEVMGYLDMFDSEFEDNISELKFLDRILYKETNRDEFWQDLKKSVASFLKERNETTHYTVREGILFICYYLCIYLCLSYMTWIKGSFLAAMLLGLHAICMLANIAHMATHSGFTNSPLLDFIAMHLFDLTGMSGLEWQITHQSHHHSPHSSIDHQTTSYTYIGVRIHKYMRHRFYHRYQFIYFWVSVSFYLLLKLVITTAWVFVYGKFVRHNYDLLILFLARIILFAQVYCCYCMHGLWMAIAVFAVYMISYSEVAFVLLFNDHEDNHNVLGKVKDVSNFHKRTSWAEVQVRTSNNWYPTNWFLAFIEFHYGYFNYHIEHHLFPTLKPILLKKISPTVKRVCAKHGIPYISTTFMAAQMSLQKHLTKMAKDETAMQTIHAT